MNTTLNSIRKRISTVELQADDILRIDISPNEFFHLEDMFELVEAAETIGNGKRFRNLIKVGDDTLPDHEARSFSTSKEGSKYKIADAFVIGTQSQKIVANFYMKFHKPCVPTRFFCKEEKALQWLTQFN